MQGCPSGAAASPRRILQPSAGTFRSGAPDKFEQKAPHRSGSSIGPASALIAISPAGRNPRHSHKNALKRPDAQRCVPASVWGAEP